MKIKLNDIGPIRQAEFELGKITILCGENNTGKTYATYATYGFFEFLHSSSEFKVKKEEIQSLIEKGSCIIPLKNYISQIQEYINKKAENYSKIIYKVFAGRESHFKKTKIQLSINNTDIDKNGKEVTVPSSVFFGKTKSSRLDITLQEQEDNVVFSLISNNKEGAIPDFILQRTIQDIIGTIILARFIPRVYIASAERTGAALFQRELDFTKSRILDILLKEVQEKKPLDALLNHIFSKNFTAKYPLAVRDNVDFIRELDNITEEGSPLFKTDPRIVSFLEKITDGTYEVDKNNEIIFVSPRRKKIPLVEASSSVKTLALLFFYIKYVLKKGDLLIVDEPELNLHPTKQRLIACLFARLANAGINIFITTHSDYIVKEINNLILLNKKHRDYSK